jgi:hypothetical protein
LGGLKKIAMECPKNRLFQTATAALECLLGAFKRVQYHRSDGAPASHRHIEAPEVVSGKSL